MEPNTARSLVNLGFWLQLPRYCKKRNARATEDLPMLITYQLYTILISVIINNIRSLFQLLSVIYDPYY